MAYADFVTAMMALFMVLWISAQDEEIRIATSKYFQNPFNAPLQNQVGVITGQSGGPSKINEGKASPSSNIDIPTMHKLAQEFYRLLQVDENLEDKPIEIRVTSDGLRITVFDRGRQPVFVKDTTRFTEWGDFVMQNVAWLLEQYDMRVRIDSFTPAGFKVRGEYGAWELTADRANAVRRKLEFYALHPEKIDRVTGFGDSRPLPNIPSEAEANQRIELSLAVGRPGGNFK